MARYDRRITVYPHPRVYAVIGDSAGQLNQALEAWATLIARATQDNETAFAHAEWCLIADVCNSTLWEPSAESPGVLIAANVSDGHHLDGTGYKWLADEGTELAGSLERIGAGKPTKAMREVDARVSSLVKRLAALDAVHAWAVVVAVQFFWEHAGAVDSEAPWYTLAYRRQYGEAEGKGAGRAKD